MIGKKYLIPRAQYHVCKYCGGVLTIIALLYFIMRTFPMILLCSEGEPEETLPASRVISSQILGYDGREVDSKERVEVTFPVHVSLCFTPAII